MWTERRVGDLGNLINGYPFDAKEFSNQGDVPLVRIRDINSDQFETFIPRGSVPATAYVSDGDVVIGMDGDFNVAYWSRGRAALNQRLCILRPIGESDTRFLAYALPSHLKVINDLTYSTTVKHLSSAQVRAIRLLAPSLEEQRTIADFLDRETARIDTLIEEQQRLIALLALRRRAVLDEATTAVSGPQVRLKYLFGPSSDSNYPDEQVLSV
ncbi:restriction endonuclease subunit S, partial [Gordonia sp. (in: high G+C Gram-positive bacteria)]|uniref:restriction endonuclease subunit S n=1 Tax=Gordonia sp. (in: high G+C Gram-positive bacteria) TaxID=84139 RepID=UPI00168F4338